MDYRERTARYLDNAKTVVIKVGSAILVDQGPLSGEC